MIDVSIIIVNYNTERLIADCVDSILQNVQDVEYEIIIVDNDSIVDSLNRIEQKYPSVKILRNGANIGFGAANNRGVEIAEGRNLFLLNPDTILLNNAVKILSDTIDRDNKIGVCGGNLYNKDLSPNHSYIRLFPGIRAELNLLFVNFPARVLWGQDRYFNNMNTNINVARVSGADMMISKALYVSMGGFDEDFFMYTEETEFMYRIKNLGYNIISNPNAKIIHLEGKSFTFKEMRYRFMMISRKKFLEKKYNNMFFVWLCDLIHIVACFNYMVASKIIGHSELYKTWKFFIVNAFKINKDTPYIH